MPKKLTQAEFITRAKATWGERYDFSRVNYINSKEKVEVLCPHHGSFWITPNDFLNAHGCRLCGNETKANKLRSSQQEFLHKATNIWGNRYDLTRVKYLGKEAKVEVICQIHGSFWVIANDFLRGHSCPKCGGVAKLTQQDFVVRARQIHGSAYILSSAKYKSIFEKVEIICRKHGSFWITPSSFINQGSGCPQCGIEKRSNSQKLTQEQFIQKAMSIHENKFDFSRSVYKSAHEKVEIVCKEHGSWWAKPNSILNGHGCPKCGVNKRSNKKKLSQNDFLERAIAIWGDHYILDKIQYKFAKEKIEIVCKQHGPWLVRPYDFCNGHGCPRCSKGWPSKGEDALADFIESLKLEVQRSNRTILRPLELDIYIPEKHIAVEYNGHYFHSDQQKDRNYHYEKFCQCRDQGIRLIQIMDIIWKTRQEQVKSLLRNALGVTDGPKLDARKCQVQEVKIAQLKAFFEQNHIQGHVHTAKVALALVYEGEIVAGMSLGKGTNQRGKAREGKEAVWTLSRYATSCLARGGFQKLLKHGRQIIGMDQSIVTYSMNDYFSGNMYAQAGFRMDGEVAPDYQVYHYRCGLKPKSHWQRRNIPARLEEIGWEDTFDPNTDERTEWEVENEVGALRIWDSGKTRWLLEKQKCAT